MDPPNDQFIFRCETQCFQLFYQALLSITWKDNEPQACSVGVSPTGILFMTEDVTVLQASAFLKSSLFQRYYFNDSPEYSNGFDFRINLKSIVDCLRLLKDTASNLRMFIMKNEDSELRINITDTNAISISDCTIRTLHSYPEQNNFPKDISLIQDAAQFTIFSNIVREMFRYPNDTKNKSVGIGITVDPVEKLFEVRASGIFGNAITRMQLLAEHKVKFQIQEKLTAYFPVSSLTPVLKAMELSSRTLFIFKIDGVLRVQLGITGDSGIETIVEFILQPLEEDPF